MSALMGVIREGRVELEAPATFPDGTRVRVEEAEDSDGFLREEDWPTTPEGIEQLIQKMKNTEPVILTPEEEIDIRAFRAASKAKSVESFRRRMESAQ